MKYTDKQRIEHIIILTEKLLKYIEENNITRKMVTDVETVRWTITTPLYNIGEQVYNLSDEF